MDTAYLKGTVGDALADGLTEVACKQPSDPVEFLAYWLLNYCDVAQMKEKEEDDKDELESLRIEHAAQLKQNMEMEETTAKRRVEDRQAAARDAEEERQKHHRSSVDTYETEQRAFERELAERRIPHKKKGEVPLTEVQKARFRLDRIKGLLGALPPALLAEWQCYTPETHKSQCAVLAGVLYLLGYSKATVDDWSSTAQLLDDGAAALIARMVDFKAHRVFKESKVLRAQKATKGASAVEAGRSNFAPFLFAQYLLVAVQLRNAAVEERRAADDSYANETVNVRVFEMGTAEEVSDGSESFFEVYEDDSVASEDDDDESALVGGSDDADDDQSASGEYTDDN